jgi:hypothetical protein
MKLRDILKYVRSGQFEEEMKEIYKEIKIISLEGFGIEKELIKLYALKDVAINEIWQDYNAYLIKAAEREIIRLYESGKMWRLEDGAYYIRVEGKTKSGDFRSFEFWESIQANKTAVFNNGEI